MNYCVTECYVDFPMGASPEYPVSSGLTHEEATNLAKELNDKETKENPTSGIYRVYNVREDR